MEKFTFDTSMEEVTTYDGPSGERYVINKGLPFVVNDPGDIDFFENNPRFSRIKLFTPKPIPKKDVDELLMDELNTIKGLTKKTKEKVVKLYLSKESLTQHLEGGYKLDRSITKTQKDKIKKYILKGDDD